MDEHDRRQDKTLDELADAFLSPPSATPRGSQDERSPGARSSERSEAARPEGDSDATRPTRDALEGPAPYRMRPKPVRAGPRGQQAGPRTAGTSGAKRSASDHGAGVGPSLHLSDAGEPAAWSREAADRPPREDEAPPPRLQRVRSEAVLLANLPGFGGPWLTQYAHAAATAEGRPVLLLRVEGERMSCQLVPGATGGESGEALNPQAIARLRAIFESPRAQTGRHPAGPSPSEDEDHDAARLLALLDALTDPQTWGVDRVLVGAPHAPERALELATWTILSGADDAAVASVDRLLDQLTRTGEVGPGSAGRHPKRVELAVMGAGTEQAGRAVERLRRLHSSRTSESEVEEPSPKIRSGICVPRMRPVRPIEIGRIEQLGEAWALLTQELTERERDDASASGWTADRTAEPAGAATRAPSGSDVATGTRPDRLEAESGFAFEPSRGETTRAAKHSQDVRRGATASDDTFETETETQRQLETEALGADARSASHPYRHRASAKAQSSSSSAFQSNKPRSEGAADAAPGPDRRADDQLLRTSDAAEGHPPLASFLPGLLQIPARCPRHPEVELAVDEEGVVHLLAAHRGSAELVMVSLMQTGLWLDEHFELIQLTQRQLQLAPGRDPVLHVFTGEPKKVVRGATEMGERIHVHLLSEIAVGAQSTWHCVELL